VLSAVLVMAALVCATGCATRTSGGPASVRAERAPIAWPQREQRDVVLEVKSATPGVALVEQCKNEHGALMELITPDDSAWSATIEMPSLGVRFKQSYNPTGLKRAGRWLLFTSAASLSVPATLEFAAGPDGPARSEPSEFALNADHLRPILIVECRGRPPVGTCVLLPSLVGPRDVEATLFSLSDRGWRVVSFQLADFLRPLRVLQRSTFGTGETSADLGAMLADELADSGYATQMVLELLVANEPALAEKPLVMVGSSLRALELPACAALVSQSSGVPTLSAAVLIGGGAGVDDIMLRGGLGRAWLREVGAKLPNDEDTAAWAKSFREACSLAPERALWSLDNIPVLLVDARFDAIVPRSTADRLWRELGEPERWTDPVGHIGLFWVLGTTPWNEVAAWIDRTTNTPPAIADANAAGNAP